MRGVLVKVDSICTPGPYATIGRATLQLPDEVRTGPRPQALCPGAEGRSTASLRYGNTDAIRKGLIVH